MHAPDGFIDAPISIVAGVVAAGGIAVCLRGARRELDDRTAPLAGLVAVYVFAVQMLNFPVAGGTSGHLLGGTLAAVLVGPFTGALCVSVVLLVQALLFADGGLTALGVNISTMALATVLIGYLLARLLIRFRVTAAVAAGLAAAVSVVGASLVFVFFYALGGTTDVALGTVTAAMVGVHALIGIGEGLITAVTVAAIASTRPDLVHLNRFRRTSPAIDAESVPVEA
jgi:cobalamin biosynthesis protein CbiM